MRFLKKKREMLTTRPFRQRLTLWMLTENDKICLWEVDVKWIRWSANRKPLFVLAAHLQEGRQLLDIPKGTCFELMEPCLVPFEYDESKLIIVMRDCELLGAITKEPTSRDCDIVPTLEARFTCQEAIICDS